MRKIKYGLWVTLFGVVISCGYRLEGGGYLNDTVTRAAVTVLENKSTETYAGIAFTNALIREISQKTNTKVVDKSTATAVLEGTITAITFESLSRVTTESVLERRISAKVDLKLMDMTGQVIWSVKDFVTTSEYTVSVNSTTDESNKREAIDELSVRTAEKLISRLTHNF
jgi:hypothetical protein